MTLWPQRRTIDVVMMFCITPKKCVSLIMTDSPANNRVEQALRMARASVEHSSDGIAWITSDARIVEANPAYCRFFGFSREEMLQMRVSDIDPHYNAAVWPLHWEQLRKHKTLTFETESVSKSGNMVAVEVVANWVVFDEQEFNCAFLRDITQRRLAEQQLHLLETCVSRLNDVVLITEADTIDGDGPRIVFANDAFERMTGYSREQVIGQTPRILQGPKTSRVELDRIRAALAAFKPVRAQLINYTAAQAEYWIEIDIVPIANAGGQYTHFVAVERDITERKLAEQRKLEFVSTVSHELRTPLTSIRGSLGLIAGGVFGELPEKMQAMLKLAHDNSARLSSLINDLLDVQKMEAGMMQFDFAALPVAQLLRHAVESNLLYGQQLGVSIEIDGRMPPHSVRVDAGRMQQVLTNLLSNACKFSHPGGVVSVRARQIASRLRIEVQDFGPGIPDAFRGRIFQKFSQADSSDARAKGGTGLGLAIAREIVLHMGGEIGYDSSAGQGTVFYIDLPIVPAAA